MVLTMGRVVRRHGGRRGLLSVGMLGALTLLCLWSGLIAGCRDSNLGTGPGREGAIFLNFTVGDTFLYDAWELDEFGYRVNGKKQETLHVVGTGVHAQGMDGVSVVLDSLGGSQVDTLFLRSTSDGDLYQYGFLARLVKRTSGKTITPRWDLLLHSGQVSATRWVVGVADSAASDTVQGALIALPEYFAVNINGKPSVFPAYQVELNGLSVQFVFWVTDMPSCISGFREEPTATGNGFEAYMTSARVAHG